MPLITWNDSYSVDVPKMDNQHKKLIDLLNTIYDALKAGKSKDIVKTSLDSMARYAFDHFQSEEAFMKTISYPDLNQHKLTHEKFIQKVTEMFDKYENGQASIGMEISNFLNKWLTEHIRGIDKKYGQYAKSKQTTTT